MGDGIESERILYAGAFGSDNETFGDFTTPPIKFGIGPVIKHNLRRN
jgi:hypothetical protein